MTRRGVAVIASIAAIVAAGTGLALWSLNASTRSVLVAQADEITDASSRGAVVFYGDDFGGLSATSLQTHALPWKLSAAALMYAAKKQNPNLPLTRAELARQFHAFGFLTPDRIGNWPSGVQRVPSSQPLGLTHGTMQLMPGLPLEVSNLGCAACHAGVTYRADGSPDSATAWLGTPNTSINLEAYTMGVYHAYQVAMADPDGLMRTLDALFPDTSAAERFTLHYLVLPQVRSRLSALRALGRPLAFPNGSPGATNGVAALKMMLHVPMTGGGKGETGFTSIPDLGAQGLRTSLLYDGAYAPVGAPRQAGEIPADVTPAHTSALAAVATFFSVPSMGVKPANTLKNQARAEAVFAFLGDYHAPAFPGAIDSVSAERGRRIYAGQCAACHGTYDASDHPKLVSFPNWIGDVGTDRTRADAFTPDLVRAVTETAYRKTIAAAHTGQYVAPPLSGLWLSAPYLHNGSVPTLMALLTPSARPQSFLVGGHRLDFKAMGIDLTPQGTYPAGYVPWSTPQRLDTTQPGLSNAGHTFGATLTPRQKQDLINYLKLL